MIKKVWMIFWCGRDSETEIWDDYPCYHIGVFFSEQDALHYMKTHDMPKQGKYDEWAEDYESYYVKSIPIVDANGKKF